MDLSKYQIKAKSKINSERQLIIKDFLDRLNQERKPPHKPLTPARLGMLLSLMTVSQMKTFYADCNYAKHFSKYFWYKLNPNNYE